VFLCYHVPETLSKSLALNKKTEHNSLIKMAVGHLGQLNVIELIKDRIKFCNYVYECQG